MANGFVEAFNPFKLIEGYEFGQKMQREEDKALQDIEMQRLRNELLGTTVEPARVRAQEFVSPEATAARAAQTRLAGTEARLGETLAGYKYQTAQERKEDILRTLSARTGTERLTAEQALAERQKLGELQPGRFKLMEGEQELAVQTQQKQLADVGKQLASVGLEKEFGTALVRNPNATTYDALIETYRLTDDPQKKVIARQLLMKQDADDLREIATVEGVDQFMRRITRQQPSRATIEGGQIVVYPIVGKDAQGRDVLSRENAQRFPDFATWRATMGAQIPGATGRAAATTRAQPGDLGRQIAGAVTGAGAAPQQVTPSVGAPPATAPAPAPAPATQVASAAPGIPGAVFSTGGTAPTAAPAAAPAATPAPAPAPAPRVVIPERAAPGTYTPSMEELRVMFRDAARGGTTGRDYVRKLLEATEGDVTRLGLSLKDRVELQRMIETTAAAIEKANSKKGGAAGSSQGSVTTTSGIRG